MSIQFEFTRLPFQVFRRGFPLLAWALGGILLAGVLPAQEKLTPASLSAWQATGKAAAADTASGTITVPAGGELTRTFDAQQVSVRLVSRPFFSPAPASLPALEVGPASLTFVRDKAGGALVLLGDQPLTLPFTITLGADGRSAGALDFTLGYDQAGKLATLVLTGEPFSLAVTSPAGPLTVIVAAGPEQSWTLDTLEVQVGPSGAVAPASSVATDTPGVSTDAGPAVIDQMAADAQDFENSRALFQAGDVASAEKILFNSNTESPGTGAWALEAGIKLMHMAASLDNRHEPAIARVVAVEAITMLQEAETRLLAEGKRKTAGRTQSLIGVLSELILRDQAAAQKAYGAALDDDAESPGAKNADTRLGAIKGGQ